MQKRSINLLVVVVLIVIIVLQSAFIIILLMQNSSLNSQSNSLQSKVEVYSKKVVELESQANKLEQQANQSGGILFVQVASSATISPIPDQQNNFTLTLSGLSYTTFFTDRPRRASGSILPAQLVKSWFIGGSNSFAAVPPNAALIITSAPSNSSVILMELFPPTYDNSTGTLQFPAETLQKSVQGPLASFASKEVNSGTIIQPMKLGQVSLFIDNAEDCVVGPDAQCGGAQLQNSDLSNSNLRNANLTNANLQNSNLTNTSLLGANLTGANLNGAILCQTTMPDASVDNSGCSLNGSGGISGYWLATQMKTWQTASVYPLEYGVLFTRASYTNINAPYNTDPVLNAELQMLQSTHARAIRLDIDYTPWLHNDTAGIAQIDRLVADVRGNGSQLIIADAAAAVYKGARLSWPAFQAAWVQRVQTLAARYHPDYYIVIKEPGWYLPMIQGYPLKSPNNGSQWVNLTQSLVNAVKAVSPNTIVGVAIAANMYHQGSPLSLSFLTYAVKVGGLDFIGFDIYTTFGFTDTLQFLNTVGANGKQIWIAEAWSSTATLAFDPSRSNLDVQWLNSLYYFALYTHAVYAEPFFTDCFSSYSWTSDSFQIISTYQQRTPVFYAFQNLTSMQ